MSGGSAVALTYAVDSYKGGYSTLAAIEDSDPNFLIYRKFGWLRNRLLLDLQDELVTLEEELQLLDDNDERLCDPEDVLISRRNDEMQKTLRQDLLKVIRKKLSEYGMSMADSIVRSPWTDCLLQTRCFCICSRCKASGVPPKGIRLVCTG